MLSLYSLGLRFGHAYFASVDLGEAADEAHELRVVLVWLGYALWVDGRLHDESFQGRSQCYNPSRHLMLDCKIDPKIKEYKNKYIF